MVAHVIVRWERKLRSKYITTEKTNIGVEKTNIATEKTNIATEKTNIGVWGNELVQTNGQFGPWGKHGELPKMGKIVG